MILSKKFSAYINQLLGKTQPRQTIFLLFHSYTYKDFNSK